jgi:phage tail-like protein
MPETANPGYPFTVFNFRVYVDDKEVGGFSECGGLNMETDLIEYRTGKDEPWMGKQPGLKKFTAVTLKRGFTKDTFLYDWRKSVIDGKTQRRSGAVELLGEDKTPVLRWNFFEAWPTKLEGPALNAKNNEVAIETMELAVERLQFEVVKGG